MTKPANLFTGKEQITVAMKSQFWILFVLIVIIAVVDTLSFQSNFVVTRSFVAGAVLSLCSQYLVAWLVFRNIGYQARNKIVNNLYLAEFLKWMVTIIGFIVIFISIKPISAGFVMLGYLAIQISHIILMIKIK